MKIGNIVTSDNFRVNKNINLVNSIDDIIDGVPTLVVGIDNIRKIEPKPDFLTRQISDKIFWTFTKKEKRQIFEEDLYYFVENCYKRMVKDVRYIFVDMIILNEDKIKRMFDKISGINNLITFKYKDMIYIYGDNLIFGVDLKQVRFINKDVGKITDKIKTLSSVFLDNEKILIKYNNELEIFDNQIKYIPLLYSINKDE
jgi:hypothetical protein